MMAEARAVSWRAPGPTCNGLHPHTGVPSSARICVGSGPGSSTPVASRAQLPTVLVLRSSAIRHRSGRPVPRRVVAEPRA